MTKRKKPKQSDGPTLHELTALAQHLELPAGVFDGDLRDAADDEADMIYEDAQNSTLREQLEFLHMHGYQLGRLEEIIREYAAEEAKTK